MGIDVVEDGWVYWLIFFVGEEDVWFYVVDVDVCDFGFWYGVEQFGCDGYEFVLLLVVVYFYLFCVWVVDFVCLGCCGDDGVVGCYQYIFGVGCVDVDFEGVVYGVFFEI